MESKGNQNNLTSQEEPPENIENETNDDKMAIKENALNTIEDEIGEGKTEFNQEVEDNVKAEDKETNEIQGILANGDTDYTEEINTNTENVNEVETTQKIGAGEFNENNEVKSSIVNEEEENTQDISTEAIVKSLLTEMTETVVRIPILPSISQEEYDQGEQEGFGVTFVIISILQELSDRCLVYNFDIFDFMPTELDSKENLVTFATSIIEEILKRIEEKDKKKSLGKGIHFTLGEKLSKETIADGVENEVKELLNHVIKRVCNESKYGIIEEILEEIFGRIFGDVDPHIKKEVVYKTYTETSKKELPTLIEEKPTCFEYMGVSVVAEVNVRKAIEDAKSIINAECPLLTQNEEESEEEELQRKSRPRNSTLTYFEVFDGSISTSWPTIEDFTPELGKSKIAAFVNTWNYSEDWLYCINYLQAQSDKCSDYYYYKVIWSIPTPMYPVSQATANVFFTIGVSRVIPKHCLVDVSYVFEGSKFVHIPGKIEFQEDWLFNIIDAKIALFKSITF